MPLVAELALRLGATLAPAWTAERAIDRFLGTRRRRASPIAAEFRASGARIELELDGERIVARSWGAGPLVLLLHGWNGGVTDFRHLVPALVRAGLRAVAVEARGHGESDGDWSTAVHLARALERVSERLGPARAVVAHSFGAPAAALALARGAVRTERLVLIAPVARPAAYVEAIGAGLGGAFTARLVDTLSRRVGLSPAELSLAARAGDLDVPTLVLHDTEDRETPIGPVERDLAGWSGARLLRTDGLGHRRILSHPAIAAAIVGAAKGTNVRACVHGRLGGACATCALEEELYRREDRAA